MKKPLRSSIKEIEKGKKYLITVYLEHDDEKGFYPKLRRTYYGTKAEAEAYQREWLWELEHPEEEAEAGSTETVSEWLWFWLENDVPVLLKWEQNTLRRAKGIIKHNLEPNIGKIILSELSADDVLKMYKKLSIDGGRFDRPLSQRTLRYVHTILNQALAQAVVRKKIPDNPCKGLTPAPPKARPRDTWVVLDEKQLSEFLHGLIGDKYYPLIYTAAYTGARQSELLGLIWTNIIWDESTLRIDRALHRLYDDEEEDFEHRERTKNETSTRDVDVSERVINVLRQHRECQKAKGVNIEADALVFTDDIGEPINSNSLISDFRKISKGLNHPQMTFHDLRHTHATILLSRGEYVNEVSARLGHASPRTTYSVYGHVLPKNKRRLSTNFDQYVPE